MNGASEAAEICREPSLYPAAPSSLGSIVLFPRAGKHRGPESILSEAEFGMEVLMLKRLGRGVTRPLHWEGGGRGGVHLGGLAWWRHSRVCSHWSPEVVGGVLV